MQPDELMMSDVPWAVAWYGDHQCVWTTSMPSTNYFQFNDYIKPVSRALSDAEHAGRQDCSPNACKAARTVGATLF